MKMHHTSNNLDSNVKTASITMLNARVADTIDLSLATKQAHWNIKGPNFMSVHLMLDTLRAELDEYVDTMAERVAQLGGIAMGTTQTTDKSTKLPPYPTEISAIPEHLKEMVQRTSMVGSSVRKNIDESDEAGDADTADIFTEVSRGLDKWTWFLESHLEK